MKCVILGAGKIARGFIGHLLYLSEIPFIFIEKSDALTELLNRRGQYTVNILGNSGKNCVVKGAKAVCLQDEEQAVKTITEADAVFTAVGGKNLEALVPCLTKAIEEKAKKGGSLNIVTCENWKLPADILRNGIEKRISEDAREYLEKQVGITEAVIMRSAIESDPELLKKDPLIVNVQDFWELPVDASRIVGELPAVRGLKLVSEFSGFLERKFYTYNAANGTVSYLGALLGYEKLADAAHDERIVKILDGVYQETARALSAKHHFPLEEQLAFTLTSKRKLQDYTIVDFIERNARDPLRKLGRDDRLVGSARLAQEYGICPEHLCIAIAAAVYYVNPEDESAVELESIRKEGVDAVLEKVCRLDPSGELGMLVKEKIRLLKEWGWIHE
ncbi:MAG TPA: hypothetical protein IAA26_01375 [Candidatus Blautia faecipullorum]|nr:hypothetical protein [Candidatus Blautia faecipullorum]